MKLVVVFALLVASSSAWDTDDYELFDVVEEVGQNFYDLLGVPENADATAIRKQFRKLSLVLHPDKNPAPDADVKFRQLVAVYEILKDPSRRSKYNDVLVNGLPDWKQAVYYYRRVRKMGLTEMFVILFIIITIGQYLVAWAAYFEKKYAIEEFVSMKSKKLQKRQKKGKAVDMETINVLPELVAGLPKPTVSCTLPVQLCKLCWFLVIDAPPLTYRWIVNYFEERKRQKEREAEESSSEEEVYVPRERAPRRRKGFTLPEVNDDISEKKPEKVNVPVRDEPAPALIGGIWTDDDFVDLIRLMKKYPQGTQERWEKIGVAMRRAASEVAHMAHKIKEGGFNPITKKDDEVVEEDPAPKKVKTKGAKVTAEEASWSQVQQKAFESALAANPKGSAGDRWERIASAVPGKTKEECMLRYKSIVDQLKRKKEKEPLFEEPLVAAS